MLRVAIWGLVVLVVAVAAVAGWSLWRFTAAVAGDVRRLESGAKASGTIVTADMLAALPGPARRYLDHAGVVGKPIPALVRLKQAGRIRGSADAKWMELEADETYSTDPPAFVWRAWFPRPTFPIVLGRDEYLDGKGSILMKMLGLVAVADEHGEELGAAGLMRYLNEMMWFPAAFLGRNVAIAAVDDGAFDATISDRGMRATARLFVDSEGRLTNFRATRFNTATRTMETWETPVGDTRSLGGLNLPATGSAVWKLPGGDFTYIELTITAVAYDAPLP